MDIRLDPTQRFSGRASSYARARPGYPQELFDHLFAVRALYKGCTVADLGAGTGIFSELLLRHGMTVYAIEPNQEMRAVAEARLAGVDGFKIVVGSAEQTTLAEQSVDAITAAQAFHWFDIEPTRREAARILRPGGQVIMVWNNRDKEIDAFNRSYSSLVERFAKDKEEIDSLRRNPEERFYPSGYHHAQFRHSKEYELESLECLITSASYMPKPGDPDFQQMIQELRELFKEFQEEGKVAMKYVTDCYHGGLD